MTCRSLERVCECLECVSVLSVLDGKESDEAMTCRSFKHITRGSLQHMTCRSLERECEFLECVSVLNV